MVLEATRFLHENDIRFLALKETSRNAMHLRIHYKWKGFHEFHSLCEGLGRKSMPQGREAHQIEDEQSGETIGFGESLLERLLLYFRLREYALI